MKAPQYLRGFFFSGDNVIVAIRRARGLAILAGRALCGRYTTEGHHEVHRRSQN
ncbi:hypothetical protein [Cupriavidus sp. PET2-C1]